MKKFFLASAIVASLCFVGCSSDDDSGDGGSGTDCFDCSISGISTEFCYTDGDDFYTMTVLGMETEQSLDGLTWDEVKSGFSELCD